MRFTFTAEEEDLRQVVRDFVQKEIIEKELNSSDNIPKSLIRRMGELGYFSLGVPEKQGGQSASWVDMGMLVEELAMGDAGIALLMGLSYQVAQLIAEYGRKSIVETYLPKMAAGQMVGCISVTETSGGCDISALRTSAVKDGDRYIITGEKCPVSLGGQADFTILLAKTAPVVGLNGISAFLVPLDSQGVSLTPVSNMGLLSSSTVLLALNKVAVSADHLIGEENSGFDVNAKAGLFSDSARLLLSLIALGQAQYALSRAIQHTRQRKAFGRPIEQFEAISGKIAEDATLIEAGRWLCYRGLSLRDQGQRSRKEAVMCGWWCPKIASTAIEDVLLIHGHEGYSNDRPFEKMLRDVIALELIAGTEEVLKLLLAEDLTGRATMPDGLTGAVA